MEIEEIAYSMVEESFKDMLAKRREKKEKKNAEREKAKKEVEAKFKSAKVKISMELDKLLEKNPAAKNQWVNESCWSNEDEINIGYFKTPFVKDIDGYDEPDERIQKIVNDTVKKLQEVLDKKGIGKYLDLSYETSIDFKFNETYLSVRKPYI